MTAPNRHPKRLTPPAAPGTLLKGSAATLEHVHPKEGFQRDPAYLAMIRQCPCLRCGLDPAGEAAHVRQQSAPHGKRGGFAAKPADKWALPLCAGCHREDSDSQHRIGELAFWEKVGLNPLLVCERIYAKRGDLVAMRAAAYVAIAERESLSQIAANMRRDD
jgi:hypothetical protein